VKATKGRAAEVQSAAKARENDSAPGVQPEAPSRAIRTYREARRKHDMTHSATTATAPSTPTDQRVRLVIEAEIFQDLDGGPDSLIVTTDVLACQPTAPARLLGMVAEARAKLDHIERLAKEYEARDTLRAIVAEHGLVLEELDTDTLFPEHLRGKLKAWYGEVDGTRIIAVPAGQDPVERVNVVAALVNDLQAQA
jgi:hypothetical protein